MHFTRMHSSVSRGMYTPPDRILDTRLWKYYLLLRTIKSLKSAQKVSYTFEVTNMKYKDI